MSVIIQSQKIYTDQTFKDVDLGQAPLQSCEFYDCTFNNCSFIAAILHECRFINCTFQNCDLSLVQLRGSSFSLTRFEDSKVIGVNWTQTNWKTGGLGIPVNFTRCVINHSTFIGLNLRGIKIVDCFAVGVDFRETDLSQADFSGTVLTESLFGNTDLSEANLSSARNYHIVPAENTLNQTRFSMPEAMSLLYNLDIVLTDEE
jgi:uncharacterized protein YjbI with pentapeptide repeats